VLFFGYVFDVRVLTTLADDVELDGFDLVRLGFFVMSPLGVDTHMDFGPGSGHHILGRQFEQCQFFVLDF